MVQLTHYEVLGLLPDASVHEIKAAYRKLSKIHHPDKGGDKEDFSKIYEAYLTLQNANRRNEYDNSLKRTTMDSFVEAKNQWQELLSKILRKGE